MRYKHLSYYELGKKTRELSNKILDEKDKQMFSGFSENRLLRPFPVISTDLH